MNGDRTNSNEIPSSKLNDDLAKLEILKKQSFERNQTQTQMEILKAQMEQTQQHIPHQFQTQITQQSQSQSQSPEEEDTILNRISSASSNVVFWMSVWACCHSGFEYLLKSRTEKYSEFANKLVNIIHAFSTSALSLDMIYRRGVWDKDLINPFPKTADHVFSMASAFMLYELLWENKPKKSTIFHHVIAAYGTFLMMIVRKAPFFPLAYVATEMTLVPQGIYWMLMHSSYKSNQKARQIILGIRVVAFFIFRTFVLPRTILFAQKRGMTIEKFFTKLPLIVSIPSAFNMVSLGILNFIWTKDVITEFLKSLTLKSTTK